MRIAFIGLKGIPGNFTGVETYVEEIGARLARAHEVWAYCRPHYVSRSANAEYMGIRRVWLPSIRTKHLDASVHSLLASVHASFGRFDIYHYQAIGPSMFSVLPRVRGGRIVVTVHGLDWARAKWGRGASLALLAAERVMVRTANAIIVVGRSLQRYYRERYGIETECIPNGVYPPRPQPADLLEGFGLEPHAYLLFMARLTPEKGAHFLIEAFRKIDADVKLVVAGTYQAGERWYYDKLRALAAGDDRIAFVGWVAGEVKDALLQHALAFVQPSTLEGLSIGLLEAAAAGVLCVASDIDENREILQRGGESLGLFFKSADVASLVRTIEALLNMPVEQRRAVAQRAREHVLSEFNWDKAAAQTEKVYESLL